LHTETAKIGGVKDNRGFTGVANNAAKAVQKDAAALPPGFHTIIGAGALSRFSVGFGITKG
jgi:hypothetical protein